MPASISASVIALMLAGSSPPSAWSTCTKMSICERGYNCVWMHASKICLIASDDSIFLRSPVRCGLRSEVANAACVNSQCTTARGCVLLAALPEPVPTVATPPAAAAAPVILSSRGPYTTATTLVLPCS
uniref:Secreted protein n=1 Tax=Globisporangium ultimum (strain ATCC 200006 / CBS 805.95 / DAOM BR144) TaxID=431595 RepID=K3WFJ8_GLOUD